MHTEGLSKVLRQEMDRKGWLRGEAHRKAKSLATGWRPEMKENEVEDWKTGKVGKAGFRNQKPEMTVTLLLKGLLAVPDKARS